MRLSSFQIKSVLRATKDLGGALDFLTEVCLETDDDETVRLTEALRNHICKSHRQGKKKDLAPVCRTEKGCKLQDKGAGNELSNKEKQ